MLHTETTVFEMLFKSGDSGYIDLTADDPPSWSRSRSSIPAFLSALTPPPKPNTIDPAFSDGFKVDPTMGDPIRTREDLCFLGPTSPFSQLDIHVSFGINFLASWTHCVQYYISLFCSCFLDYLRAHTVLDFLEFFVLTIHYILLCCRPHDTSLIRYLDWTSN